MATTAQDEFNELMRDKSRQYGHPEDVTYHDDARSFLNLSSDDDDDDDDRAGTPTAIYSGRANGGFRSTSPSRPSLNLSRSNIPTTRYMANTGPKGVISDAQNFQDSRRHHRMSLQNLTLTPAQALSLQEAPTFVSSGAFDGADDLAIDEWQEDEPDDDFMEQWRQSRLAELQQRARDAKMWKKGYKAAGHRGIILGSLAPVDGAGYLDAVDNAPPGVTVLVYIYDDMVSECSSHNQTEVWVG